MSKNTFEPDYLKTPEQRETMWKEIAEERKGVINELQAELDKSFRTIIKTETEYRKALAEAENLVAIDPKKGIPEADRLELLALLCEEYEKRHYPIKK